MVNNVTCKKKSQQCDSDKANPITKNEQRQQGGDSETVQETVSAVNVDTATTQNESEQQAPSVNPNPSDKISAPEELELKDAPNLDSALSENNKLWIEQQKRQRGNVKVRFGTMAKGSIEINKSGKSYRVKNGVIPLIHPVFQRIGDEAPGFAPHLVIRTTNKGVVSGFVAPAALAKNAYELSKIVGKAPGILGLAGFDLPTTSLVNNLKDGKLSLGIKDRKFSLGSVFAGNFSLLSVNEAVTFNGEATVVVTGLQEAKLILKRSSSGLITGTVSVAVNLPKNISGSVTLDWDGKDVTGKGKVGYQGEKLSGEVLLNVMDKEKATQKEQGQQAAKEVPAAASKNKRAKKRKLVVFGEGDLNFAFTEWLTGTAKVIIDPKGHLTVIGKITPQKEFELFPQKDYNKELFKLEARASYGIPVVGNIFIFANIGMNAFAKIGPAKFYKIIVSGTYSTDPEKSKDFSIQGSLNISAAAGLQLRGEAGAGLEILSHDIKAGAGINAMAGIRGYAEATPIIGYREKPGVLGEDKKGEFFLRGELEIAAQPFLGLSGDLFVEIDAPWWSPVPDKRWTWPLGGKEWPIGGEFGIGADVDYVFGSGQWPSLEFKPVKFDADKFITDLYSDKAASKSAKGDTPGKWKEKNAKAAEPPVKDGKSGNATPGKAAALPGAKPKVAPGTTKPSSKTIDPNTKTADGKSVKQYQDEVNKKQGKVDKKESGKTGAQQPAESPDMQKKSAGVSSGKKTVSPDTKPKVSPVTTKPSAKKADPNAKTIDSKSTKEKQDAVNKKQGEKNDSKIKPENDKPSKGSNQNKWEKGVRVVKQALVYAEKTGIEEKELNRILKSILKRKEFHFSKLYAKENPKQEKQWIVYGSMSPIKPILSIKKSGQNSVTQKALEQQENYKAPTYPIDGLYRATGPSGHVKKMKKGGGREVLPATTSLLNKGVGYMAGDHRGHLIGDRFNGSNADGNLVPMHSNLNLSTFKQFENALASEFLKLKPDGRTGEPALLFMKVTPKYPGKDKLDPASYRPTSIVADGEVTTLEKQNNEVKKVSRKIPRTSYLNPEGSMRKAQPVNLSTASPKEMEALQGIGPALSKSIVDTRNKLMNSGKFNFYEDLKQVPGINESKIRQIRSDPFRPVRIR